MTCSNVFPTTLCLQIMLLSQVLEANGVDPAFVLSSAGQGEQSDEGSEYEDDEDEDEEEGDSDEAAPTASMEEAAESPGEARHH